MKMSKYGRKGTECTEMFDLLGGVNSRKNSRTVQS